MITSSMIEKAATLAAHEVPREVLKHLRKKPPVLEFQVEGGLSRTQKEVLKQLSDDFRYNAVLTPDAGEHQIYLGARKNNLEEEIQKYPNVGIKIWQGQSEKSIRELETMFR